LSRSANGGPAIGNANSPLRDARYLSDHLRTQAEECYRLAKEARDKWVANILDNLGNQLHARADQLEAKDNGAAGEQG